MQLQIREYTVLARTEPSAQALHRAVGGLKGWSGCLYFFLKTFLKCCIGSRVDWGSVLPSPACKEIKCPTLV